MAIEYFQDTVFIQNGEVATAELIPADTAILIIADLKKRGINVLEDLHVGEAQLATITVTGRDDVETLANLYPVVVTELPSWKDRVQQQPSSDLALSA